MNQAQTLLTALGVACVPDEKKAHGSKNPCASKGGPGRFHRAGNPGNRITKDRPTRAYRALMAHWASKRITKAKLRDEKGAYTLTGRNVPVYGMNAWDRDQCIGWTPGRRVWVAR